MGLLVYGAHLPTAQYVSVAPVMTVPNSLGAGFFTRCLSWPGSFPELANHQLLMGHNQTLIESIQPSQVPPIAFLRKLPSALPLHSALCPRTSTLLVKLSQNYLKRWPKFMLLRDWLTKILPTKGDSSCLKHLQALRTSALRLVSSSPRPLLTLS